MKKLLYLLLCLFTFAGSAQEVSIIPRPAEMQVNKGEFVFNGKVVLCYPKIKDSCIDAVVDNFVKEVKTATGVKLVKDRLKNDMYKKAAKREMRISCSLLTRLWEKRLISSQLLRKE